MEKNGIQVYFVVNDLPLWQYMFSDIKADGGSVVIYPFTGPQKRSERLLYRLCNNRFALKPFQILWCRHIIKKWNVSKEKPLFVFLNPVLPYFKKAFYSFLIERYNAVLAVLFIDSAEPLGDQYMNTIKPMLDLVGDKIYTYDKTDALRYGWNYTCCYYSALPVEPIPTACDVFLVMYDKGRAEKAVKCYDYFAHRGIKCLFYIHGVDPAFALTHQRTGIVYNHPLQYLEVIRLLSGCRVILELCQHGQKANTLRAFEAVTYHKRLLTDNSNIRFFPGYDPEEMKYFASTEDIEVIGQEFFQIEQKTPKHQYCGEFSPRHLVEKIRS